MRLKLGLVAVLIPGLVACTQGGQKAADATANPACHIDAQGIRSRYGENWPTHFQVKNTGEWCPIGLTLDGGPYKSSTLRDSPAHGEVRIINVKTGTYVAYRPTPGYAGSDSFRVALGTGRGDDLMLAASVDVTQ